MEYFAAYIFLGIFVVILMSDELSLEIECGNSNVFTKGCIKIIMLCIGCAITLAWPLAALISIAAKKGWLDD